MSERQPILEALRAIGGEGQGLDHLFDALPVGILVEVFPDGMVYASRASLELWGRPWEDFAGYGWTQGIHPEDAAALRFDLTQLEPPFDLRPRYRVVRPDGEIRWVEAQVRGLANAEGAFVGTVSAVRDVSDEQRHRERAGHAQRMEAVGRLSGRVAHDLNNILGVLLGSASLLERAAESSDLAEHVATVEQSVESARQITEQLLMLSRGQVAGAATRLDAQIQSASRLLQRSLGPNIELVIELGAGDAGVPLGAGQITQVLLNLIGNAGQALESGGHVWVKTSRANERVRLRVGDDGVGMTPEVLARAREPFFTTRPVERGTGLGLSSVDDLVAAAQGALRIESAEGRGTWVEIDLPQVASDGARRPERAADRAPARRAHVLLVEDHDALRQIQAMALGIHGYRVDTAASVADAIDLAGRVAYDVIVTDVLLPDGSGIELVESLVARQPELRWLYTSGYPGTHADELAEPSAKGRFLPKPVRIEDLLAAVDSLLD